MGSRDRLAQIRAQQNARTAAGAAYDQQPQDYSYPQQVQPPAGDPYASPYGSQPVQRSRSSNDQPRQRSPPEAQGSYVRSTSQPRGLPSGPRPQGSGRRPTNPPALDLAADQFRARGPGAGGPAGPSQVWAPSYTLDSQADPPQDFNPNFNQAQRSQYSPASPAITRQRSISGGQRVSIDDPRILSTPISAPPQRGPGPSLPSQPQRPRPSQPRGASRGAPTYVEEPQPDEAAFSEKGSTINLVERGDEYETPGRRSAPKASGAKAKRGGATIKMGDVPLEEMGEFFAEVSDLQSALREAAESIQQIQSLHQRLLSLPSSDDPQAVAITQNLKETSNATREVFTSLKTRIVALEQGNANLRALIAAGQSAYNLSLSDVDVRQTQVSALKERFKAQVQRYAEVERESRSKNRSRMERQVRVVNPNLTQDEVADVVRGAEEGGNLFSQALLSSNGQRTYAARDALREVESRAAQLARIEQTLIELAQLFTDMATLVEAQDVQIIAIEQTAALVQNDVEKGLDDTKKAVVSARSARKFRWWCCGIFTVIILIVVIVVVVEVVPPLLKKNSAPAPAAAKMSAATTQHAIASAPSSRSATPTLLSASPSNFNSIPVSGGAMYPSGSGESGVLPATKRYLARDLGAPIPTIALPRP